MTREAAAVEPPSWTQLQAENDELRARLVSAERATAQTLARATRLSHVVSVLGGDMDFATVVERAAVEIAELFLADVAVLMIGPDDRLQVEGQWGLRQQDVPEGTFAVEGVGGLTAAEPVMIGAPGAVPVPDWVASYQLRNVAWARFLVGDRSLGLMLLGRRGAEPFERSDVKELRAITYRIALAMENSLLHRRMTVQLERLGRIQERTSRLAGMLELEPIGECVAEMLVDEVPGVTASIVLIDRDGDPEPLARCGCDESSGEGPGWKRFPLETPGKPVGAVAVNAPPEPGSEARELLLHLLGIAALALDKALLHEQSREQARRDSLTGLLGHRVCHDLLEQLTAARERFSVVLLDIDDFKQINDLFGHQAGDDALRMVADALRGSVRDDDTIFRVGGEEFCVVLPGLGHDDAFPVAERLRASVARRAAELSLTVSLGVASHPAHAGRREELLSRADAALYASKRSGKNRTSVAGAAAPAGREEAPVDTRLLQIQAALHDRDPDVVLHSSRVATMAVDLGRALDLSDAALADLHTAAKLHDVGKVAVPAEILSKPGPLHHEEFRVVQTHPMVGSELLRAWGLLVPARFVREHHEHVDGSGYPAGLRGEEIALESRIIHVADAYVAMTLDRPYRRAMSHESAMEELVRHRGTQFDAAVVDALIATARA